jgi:TIR domain
VDVADIFISYTSSDRDWAFWIGHELEALGHVPRIHEWEISGGGDIMAWMEDRHQAADHTLCVIPQQTLFELGTSHRSMGSDHRSAKFCPFHVH